MTHRRSLPIVAVAFAALLLASTAPALAQGYDDPTPGDDPETSSTCDGTQAETVIARPDNTFEPASVTITQGQSICFKNDPDNPGLHNVNFPEVGVRCSVNCSSDNDPSTARWEAQVKLDGTGTTSFQCDQHVAIGMTGTVTVEPSAEPQPGSLSLAQGSYEVDETATGVAVQVNRSGGTDGTVSVDVDTSDGSATAGEDYTATSVTRSWGDGDGGPKNVSVPILDDASDEGNETFTVALSEPTGGATLKSPMSAEVTITDDDTDFPPCTPDADTLCFFGDRFQVDVEWDDPRDDLDQFEPAQARTIPFTDRGGIFFFVNERNPEFLIKVLDACTEALGQHYWVFFAATTDVEFQVIVTDTEADVQKTYTNPAGNPADAVTDTSAFATCP